VGRRSRASDGILEGAKVSVWPISRLSTTHDTQRRNGPRLDSLKRRVENASKGQEGR
jgi:hypothetical protein